ncbi:MAG TPA: sialidase family protein [Gemmataceae bacterium]|nr:sialidase family protein [Gemmataceae bacterium]
MRTASRTLALAVVLSALPGVVGLAQAPENRPREQPGLLKVEFIYEKAPFPQCHASTVAESRGALVAAWFGGTRERDADVGIWVARHDGKAWSAPVEVANGVQDGGKREPCWNPILFQPKRGPLQLFYKVGPNPRTWWSLLLTSDDGGKTWSKPRRLPDGFVGSTKNNPIPLPDGSILHPSSTEDNGWRLHFERSDSGATKWEKIGPIHDGKDFGAIQPTILTHPGGKLQALCRTRQKVIAETWSTDDGKTWSKLAATTLPNPNSGIAAVTLTDGRHLLVYNHTPKGRSPLNVAVSRDGKDWQAALVLEDQPGEYSYPAVIQTSDGLVHITYTWQRRRVRHVVVDPAKLSLRAMPGGAWPTP